MRSEAVRSEALGYLAAMLAQRHPAAALDCLEGLHRQAVGGAGLDAPALDAAEALREQLGIGTLNRRAA